MLSRKYGAALKQRYFEVDLKRDGSGVYAKVTLRDRSGSFYYPVEGRIAHEDHSMSSRDAALFLVDYIDAYYEEYLRDGETFLPIDWAEYESEGVVFQLKGQVLNLEAEKLADEILAQADGVVSPLH
jgi:hypothetical protein